MSSVLDTSFHDRRLTAKLEDPEFARAYEDARESIARHNAGHGDALDELIAGSSAANPAFPELLADATLARRRSV